MAGEKKKGEVSMGRLGQLLQILFLVLIGVIVLYFVAVLTFFPDKLTNKNNGQMDENNGSTDIVEGLPGNSTDMLSAMGVFDRLEDGKLVMYDYTQNKELKLSVDSSTSFSKLDPYTLTPLNISSSDVPAGSTINVSYNKKNDAAESVLMVPSANVAGEISEKGENMIKVNTGVDNYEISVDNNTLLVSVDQESGQSVLISYDDLSVGSFITAVADYDVPNTEKSFLATRVEVVPKPV